MDSKLSMMRISFNPTLGVLILLGSIMLGGCHTQFHKRWESINAQRPTSAQASDPMVGLWEGYWIDTHHFHVGRLRAIVSKESDRHYKVDFLANFQALIINCSAEYSIELQTDTPKTGRSGVSFHGENDLGFFFGSGGIYKYRGRVDRGQWVNTFESKSGHGEFRLHRPGATPGNLFQPNAESQD